MTLLIAMHIHTHGAHVFFQGSQKASVKRRAFFSNDFHRFLWPWLRVRFGMPSRTDPYKQVFQARQRRKGQPITLRPQSASSAYGEDCLRCSTQRPLSACASRTEAGAPDARSHCTSIPSRQSLLGYYRMPGVYGASRATRRGREGWSWFSFNLAYRR